METLEKPMPAKIKVIKEEPCEITFSVELPAAEVAKESELVFSDIQKRASLPGFRAGKAPMEMIRKNFAERAKGTVLENLIGKSAAQVLREHKVQTIDRPRIEKVDFQDNKPLVYHMKVEKDPTVKAKNYKGLKVKTKNVKVTDEQFQKAIQELQERNASLVASTETVLGNTHFALIDFIGKIDDKPFQGGTSKDFLLDMAHPQTIAGFSEGILGMKLQETRTIQVRFPKDYGQKQYADKEASFEITLKEIKQKNLPKLDDEFAKDLGLESYAQLQTKIREHLETDEKNRVEKETEDQLFQALLDENTFQVPPTLVEERIQNLIKRARASLIRNGLISPDDVASDAALKEKVRPQAEKDVRLSYLFKSVAEQEKINVSPEDINEMKEKTLASNADNKEAVEKYFTENDLAIRASVLEKKIVDFIKQHAKMKVVED